MGVIKGEKLRTDWDIIERIATIISTSSTGIVPKMNWRNNTSFFATITTIPSTISIVILWSIAPAIADPSGVWRRARHSRNNDWRVKI
jgi:hypothetical protein